MNTARVRHHRGGCRQAISRQFRCAAVKPPAATPSSQEERIRSSSGRKTEEDVAKSSRTPQELRQMEDELRDPRNFLEYFFPRPLRQWFFWGSGASATLATLFTLSRVVQEPPAALSLDGSLLQDLAVNAAASALFCGLAVWDARAGEQRVEQRKALRQAQIRAGDREVYVNDQGEKMSRLLPVDDDWILRRLERWGRKDAMPFIGPKKGLLLQNLVRDRAPTLALEVGTMAGYSALLIAKALPPGSKLISIEKDLTWVLAAKRFMWQASDGNKTDMAGKKVDVRWGDALSALPRLQSDPEVQGKVELVLLDGVPKEYLAYLKACEPLLAPGAVVVADNAGIFKEGGLKPYLEYVRGSPQYDSRFLESTLEWREDVADGLEVSTYKGTAAQ